MAITVGCQSTDEGSIPFTRSKKGNKMLYQPNRGPKHFDTTIIKSVDAILDTLIMQPPLRNDLGRVNERMEYRTAFLTLPRQCGKSTYIKEVSKLFLNPFIFVRSQHIIEQSYAGTAHAYVPDSVSAIEMMRCNDASPDIILFDEIDYRDAQIILELFENSVTKYNRRCVVLGLRT